MTASDRSAVMIGSGGNLNIRATPPAIPMVLSTSHKNISHIQV
jgi:hypothetical protein